MVGWNKHVADAHRVARQKFLDWVWHGKPNMGRFYTEMCEARRVFKSRLKWCQNHQEQIKLDVLASHHSKKDFRGFWKNANKMNARRALPVSMGSVCDPQKIANLFKDHFIVKSPLGPSKTTVNVVSGRQIGVEFNFKEVAHTIKQMTKGKSPGHDGLSIEHLQNAGHHLPRLLSMLYKLCISHSFIPIEMIRTIVVPITKNKTGDLSDINNYRPISLATIIAKVFDSLLNK